MNQGVFEHVAALYRTVRNFAAPASTCGGTKGTVDSAVVARRRKTTSRVRAPDGFYRQIRSFVAPVGPQEGQGARTPTTPRGRWVWTRSRTGALIFSRRWSEAHFRRAVVLPHSSGSVCPPAWICTTATQNQRTHRADLTCSTVQNARRSNTSGARRLSRSADGSNSRTRTPGNTLCHAKKAVRLPKVVYPKPNIHASLVAKVKGRGGKIACGLRPRCTNEDPTFIYAFVDAELAPETVISAPRANCIWKSSLIVAPPVCNVQRRTGRSRAFAVSGDHQVPRATRNTARQKQTGGSGQFAEVWMRIEPTGRATRAWSSPNSLVGPERGPACSCRPVEKGVNQACTEGILGRVPRGGREG